MASDCYVAASDLRIEIEKLVVPDGKSRWSTTALKASLKTLFHSHKLQDLEKKVSIFKETLNFQIVSYPLQKALLVMTQKHPITKQDSKPLHDSMRQLEQDYASKHSNERKVQELISSLAFRGMYSREDALSNPFKSAIEGTCDWIFDPGASSENRSTGFEDWLKISQADAPLFYIEGKPGSGKSTLMKFVTTQVTLLSQLATWTSKPLAVVKYFSWSGNEPLARTAIGCLCSFASQILLQDPACFTADCLKEQPKVKGKEANDWSLADIQNSLRLMIPQTSQDFIIFLDGLDEAKDSDETIIAGILEFCRSSLKVKLCISSRPSAKLSHFTRSFNMLHVQDYTRADVELYVRTRLENNAGFQELLVRDDEDVASGRMKYVVDTLL